MRGIPPRVLACDTCGSQCMKTHTRCPIHCKHFKMVLSELGTKLQDAIRRIRTSYNIDDAMIDDMLKQISNSLIAS